MSDYGKIFLEDSEKKAFDIDHRNTINFNISKYNVAFEKGKLQYSDIESAKTIASSIKKKVINNLDSYLTDFENNFTNNGGKVIWAGNVKEAIEEIIKILSGNKAKLVVKSKSMTTEEIEFNKELQNNGIESVETDLGEFIVQIAGEKPYHIVTPAMHKSKESISELFNKIYNTPSDSTPEFITNFVRNLLREKFITADAGITGANFLIADTGSVCVTENEGNALMSTSFPKIHIAIAGIEKIIPSINDLHIFWPLLATHGTGQHITAYNSIFSGPKRKDEVDGPEEMYVILIDNGRSNLFANHTISEALSCIRCGACLNACPVYKNIGGYTYNTTYSGPIGSVIMPHLKGFDSYSHLSFASSLCGKCYEVCPVKINLPKLLLYNRNMAVETQHTKFAERQLIKGWKLVIKKRKLLNLVNGNVKNILFKLFFKKLWGKRRELPVFAKKSFNQQYNKN